MASPPSSTASWSPLATPPWRLSAAPRLIAPPIGPPPASRASTTGTMAITTGPRDTDRLYDPYTDFVSDTRQLGLERRRLGARPRQPSLGPDQPGRLAAQRHQQRRRPLADPPLDQRDRRPNRPAACRLPSQRRLRQWRHPARPPERRRAVFAGPLRLQRRHRPPNQSLLQQPCNRAISSISPWIPEAPTAASMIPATVAPSQSLSNKSPPTGATWNSTATAFARHRTLRWRRKSTCPAILGSAHRRHQRARHPGFESHPDDPTS